MAGSTALLVRTPSADWRRGELLYYRPNSFRRRIRCGLRQLAVHLSPTMEMTDFIRVRIALLSSSSTNVEVSVKFAKNKVSVAEVYSKVLREIGISNRNIPYFVLVETKDSVPVRKLDISETLEKPFPELLLHKWVFEEKTEQELLDDPGSALVIRHAAKNLICQNCSNVPQKIASQLNSVYDVRTDPSIVLESQFVSLCHSIPHYFSVPFKRCAMMSSFPPHKPLLREGEHVNMYISKSGLHIYRDALGFYAFWNSIRSWRFNPRCGTFAFEIKTATGAMGWFSMETRQVRFMYAVVSELTTMAKRKEGDDAAFLTSMIHRLSADETQVENPLYTPAVRDNPVFTPDANDHPGFLADDFDDSKDDSLINLATYFG